MQPVSDSPQPLASRLRHLSWYLSHFKTYLLVNGSVLRRGIPLREVLVLKYPWSFGTLKRPPLLSIDLTDACDLVCSYCNNPLFPQPRTFMSDEVVECILSQLDRAPLSRIRVGGGEPTLHPRFGPILKELAKRVKHLSIVTNGQWSDPSVGERLVASGVNLIEVSVDAGGAKVYERSRQAASYQRVLDNLLALRKLRDAGNRDALVKIRLMLRPSTRQLASKDARFLSNYCDCLLPQFILKHPDIGYSDDVFLQPSVADDAIPGCGVIFRDLQIRPDGRVPLCPAKGCALDPEKRIFLGDVCHDSLIGLWNGALINELRAAHRSRRCDILTMCRNCHYG
jgi:pyruvate-formate lyase-activating enzyme